MDAAFARLVGSGLLLWVNGCRPSPPNQKSGNGLELVAHLGVMNRFETRALVDFIVAHVWQRWQQVAMPHQVSKIYLDVLCKIMAEHRPQPALWTGAVAHARVAVKHDESLDDIAGRLVDRIFEPDSAMFKIDSNELDDYVAGYVLMQLFIAIMQRGEQITKLMPLVEDYYRAVDVAHEVQLAEKARSYLISAAG